MGMPDIKDLDGGANRGHYQLLGSIPPEKTTSRIARESSLRCAAEGSCAGEGHGRTVTATAAAPKIQSAIRIMTAAYDRHYIYKRS